MPLTAFQTTLSAALLIAFCTMARANEPAVPYGLDPGGVAVALLGDGVDYTRPEIAGRLARDGEGDLIAWDFTDQDIRPFSATGQTNAQATQLLTLNPTLSLVVVKGAPGDPVAIGRMAGFAVQTPARIILCPDAMARKDWPVAVQAARRFPNHLFIVGQVGTIRPEWQTIPNLLIAPAAQGWTPAVDPLELAARAAQILEKTPDINAEAIKGALVK